MNNELQEAIHNLLDVGHRAIEDVCKSTEPSVTITWCNDGTLHGEFYSYCLNLSDGGRHHTFQATNEEDLIKVLNRLVKEAKDELREREAIDRMENEGG